VIEKGAPWGEPTTATAALEVHGDDADLAAVLDDAGGALVRFEPTAGSDLARALGLGPGAPGATAVPVDALRVTVPGQPPWVAVNAVVVGPAPERVRAWTRARMVEVTVDGRERHADRATTVVIASGQFVHALDVVPRGHPGDGRIECQAYALAPRDRRGMRHRLRHGGHVPHPRIVQAAGRTVTVHADVTMPLEVDGRPVGRTHEVTVDVLPGALRLLV
jgi:putative lipid kinase YegS-like protein